MSAALRRSVFNVARTARVVPMSARAMAFTRPAFVYRSYSAAAGLTKDDIQSRVMEVMKSFEKVNPSKVSGVSYCDRGGLIGCYWVVAYTCGFVHRRPWSGQP
jgi:NADH dehydrogenase (ubiquinone) 1 alpha/beta subcomplex 1